MKWCIHQNYDHPRNKFFSFSLIALQKVKKVMHRAEADRTSGIWKPQSVDERSIDVHSKYTQVENSSLFANWGISSSNNRSLQDCYDSIAKFG